MLLFDILYFLIILLALPLWIKYLFKKEYREILKHRLSPDIRRSEKKRIWIHAVSVGEVRSLKYLMEQLKELYSDKEIVLSVTTPSGCRLAKKDYKDITVINAPLDFSAVIKKFLDKINPQILILNELEIWPNWISITQKKKIPILLINGRVSDVAFSRYKQFNLLLNPFFKKIDRFLVQANLYRERFKQLKVPAGKISVCGNIKADEAFNLCQKLPPDHEILEYLWPGQNKQHNKQQPKKIITIASSHLSDEKIIAPIINKFKNDFRFVFVPRHLTRIEAIEKLLESHQISYSTWSKKNTPSTKSTSSIPSTHPKANTLIFDKMGVLFQVLKISDIVFMGGTYEVKIGGHNLYEPAVLGKLTIGGPCTNNFPAIGMEMVKDGTYHIVEDSNQLEEFLLKIDEIDIPKVREKAMASVTRRKGSIQCILKEIQEALN